MDQNLTPVPIDVEPGTEELAPYQIIRTESELSKYPLHNLSSKRERVNIEIRKLKANGQIDIKWEVSYGERYGQARHLAYKLDTLIVNRRLDEEGRPLPELIKLGSLREIADELGLGGDTNALKKALRQNVGALISAKIRIRLTDGTEQTLEADFTRYGAIFTGEKLPDGRKADAVYIALNKTYRDVLNTAPVRPLNYEYLKLLTPSAQRFYEIISRNMFATLSKRGEYALLRYSDYCTYSTQKRHYDYENFRVQMAKIHQPHFKSGYLTKAEYEEKIDADGKVDWLMKYTPGPKARAEYNAFTKDPKAFLGRAPRRGRPRKGESLAAALSDPAPVDQLVEPVKVNRFWETPPQSLPLSAAQSPPVSIPEPPAELFSDPRQQTLELAPEVPVDPYLISELTRRGIVETEARKLVQNLPPDHPILDVLEWADFQVEQSSRGGKAITNPAGLIIWLLNNGSLPPPTFETSRQKAARLEAIKAQEDDRRSREIAERAYDEFVADEINRWITDPLHVSQFAELTEGQIKKNRERYPAMSPAQIEGFAKLSVKGEIKSLLSLPTFEEFYRSRSTPASGSHETGYPASQPTENNQPG